MSEKHFPISAYGNLEPGLYILPLCWHVLNALWMEIWNPRISARVIWGVDDRQGVSSTCVMDAQHSDLFLLLSQR